MLKKRLLLVLFFSISIVATKAQTGTDKERSSILFTVDKKPVLTEEFIYLYKKNHPDKPENYTEEKIEEYLTLFINFKLKVEEARHRGLDTTKAFRKEYGTYREELRKPYLPDAKLMDSLVELTYNRMKQEVNAAHILINVKPDASPADTTAAYKEALALRERVLKGEDFGTLAAEYSDDPSAKTNKGNLGYFTAMQMVFPFEQAAYLTPAGEVSMPVRTQFGYHIVKVIDKRPSLGEVEVSHIMIRTGEGYDNEKAKDLIFDVYDRLQKGVKWEDLCREFSQDPSSKDNGGRLRPFGVGAMAGVPQFEKTAFSMKNPGDISDPFQTQFGWHIMRLESKFPLAPFEELSASLKNRVSRDERSQVSKEALKQKMKKQFGFQEHDDVKKTVFALADTTLKKGTWKPKPGAVDETKSIFFMGERNYTVKDFFSFIQLQQKPTSASPAAYMNQLYEQFVQESLGLLMEEKIKQNNPDYAWLLKEYYEGILLFEIMEKEIWNRASEDSVGQYNYFQSHTADYRANERASGKIYSGSSRELLEQLKDMLAKNEDSLAVQQFVKDHKIRQESGAFEKSERLVLSKIEWKPGLSLAENNGAFYLVEVKEIVPPGPRTFAEARPSVISDYQNFLEKQWLSKLRKEYPVKINKKGKQSVLNQLVKTTS